MTPQPAPPATLVVRDLDTRIAGRDGDIRAVDGVSFSIERGEIFGLAGESGSGKSLTAFSILRLLPPHALCTGHIELNGTDLLQLPEAEMRRLRGDRIAMIFQDPMTSLNPVLTVGEQIGETLRQHRAMSGRAARAEAIRLMQAVEIPQAASRFNSYPHEFSGGMRQRIVIATALACNPDLLIADEPTTALDVTIERQILGLLDRLRQETGCAILLISHNLNLMAAHCRRIAIMYAGQIVEMAETRELFARPRHPYTQALLNSMPRRHISEQRLEPMTGAPPVITGDRDGCSFAPRCGSRRSLCASVPALREAAADHLVRCVLTEAVAV